MYQVIKENRLKLFGDDSPLTQKTDIVIRAPTPPPSGEERQKKKEKEEEAKGGGGKGSGKTTSATTGTAMAATAATAAPVTTEMPLYYPRATRKSLKIQKVKRRGSNHVVNEFNLTCKT